MLDRWSLGNGPRGPLERLVALALRGGSIPYGIATMVRNLGFDAGLLRPMRMPCPVFSVGNMTVGGTGKTPLVVEMVRMLSELGRRPAVVSRGYGRSSMTRPLVVSAEGQTLATAEETGDEPLLIACLAPRAVAIVVAARRAEAASLAIKRFNADAIILDDGFQHRWLARDCDLVLWDSLRPIESAALLPRGHLRENLRGLRRAQALVLTRWNLGRHGERALRRLKRMAPHVDSFRADVRPNALRSLVPHLDHATPSLDDMRGLKTAAFCGLGNPEAFWRSLDELGADLVLRRAFPDHHVPSRSELEAFSVEATSAGARLVVTTAKDAVKIPEPLPGEHHYCSLDVSLDFGDDTERFQGFLARQVF